MKRRQVTVYILRGCGCGCSHKTITFWGHQVIKETDDYIIIDEGEEPDPYAKTTKEFIRRQEEYFRQKHELLDKQLNYTIETAKNYEN